MRVIKKLKYSIAVGSLISMGLYTLPVGAAGTWDTAPSAEAFQANNGYLYTNTTGGSALNTTQGMAAYTSPAIAALKGGGYEVAFQANNGYLYLFNTKTGKTVNTLQGMESDTSPAIAALTGGGYEVAFQANNGHLYTYNWSTGPAASTQAMTPFSNPSIAGMYNNSYVIAYSALDTNDLSFDSSAVVQSYGPKLSAGLTTTDQGIETGTSPSIAPTGIGFEAAYVASGTNQLDLYYSGTGAGGTAVTLESNTSPSISELGGDDYIVAYAVPGSDDLGVLEGGGSQTIVTDQGLAPGTSPSVTGYNPSITGLDQGGTEYQVAFQAAGTNQLIVYEPAVSLGIVTGQGMASATNSSVN